MCSPWLHSARLRAAGGEYKIYKNTLVRIAARERISILTIC